ncbi:MAG: NADH-quinone oxidoreductase subunit N [Gemmatales bacterium]
MASPVIQLDFLNSRMLGDLLVFAPEAILIVAIALMLLLRLFSSLDRWHLGFIALVANLVALLVSSGQWLSFPFGSASPARDLFSGMLVFDGLSAFSRMVILGASSLTILLTILTKMPDREDSADFYVLLLGGTLGMCLMASAQHFLMIYLAIEMASVPSYVLAGFLKGKRQSGEAALKYVVYGGAASGMLLYGISLLCGRLGTGYLPDVCLSLHTLMQSGGLDAFYWMCIGFILLGLAFKLSLVPMHFWCPDVFEGAAAEVAAYLSVVSKAAALALMGRIILMLMGGMPGLSVANGPAWSHIAPSLSIAIAVVAGVTCTWGNLAAYPQTNLKRFWAYSTIAHAGYLLMPLATLTRDGLAASLVYLLPYVFMNLGVFAIVCFVRNAGHREDLAAMTGLLKRAPIQAVALTIFIIGLVGLPPFAGFLAKYEVFACLVQQAQLQDRPVLWVLLGVGVVNTVIALGYYGKLLKIALFDTPENPATLPVTFRQNLFVIALAVFIVVGIFFWDMVTTQGTQIAVHGFQPRP